MRGRRETARASVTRLLVGFSLLALAVPCAGGADSSTQTNDLRGREAALGSQAHAALLSLYSLDARLAQAQARLATLRSQSESVRAELRQVAREQGIARRSWHASVAALEAHLRTLYEQGQPDAIGVLLGASSIDDAVTSLDALRRSADLDRRTIAQTLRARAFLDRSRRELAARSSTLRALVSAAERTAGALAATRSQRAAYVASLRREQQFTRARIDRLDAAARASASRSPAPAFTDTGAPAAVTQDGSQPPPAAPVGVAQPTAGRTLTVLATGYSLGGQTATGLAVGWGVVAVDPSVIPLGTRLTIPGYGEGVAADTGGGVHGAMVDLWFPTQAQALAWGRRTVSVTLH